MNHSDVNHMIKAYIECALWSSTDDECEPLDSSYDSDDLSDSARAEMERDCEDFYAANVVDLMGIDAGQAGHDFWLTRNGHGAGFWDRGLGELGERLSRAAEVYGSVDLYVGDDQRIHI